MKNIAAFSLVETIATVGILLALISLILPITSQVRAMRESTICSSNLRQIGLGILSYTHDNAGTLPGPVLSGQYPWWYGNVNEGHATQLASYLSPYLELKRSRTKWEGNDVFVCPAFKRIVKKLGDAPVYRLNISVPIGDGQTIRQPFGYPNSYNPKLFGTTKDFPPLTLINLSDVRDENGAPATSTTWMMKDIDQDEGLSIIQTSEYLPNLPSKRVHETHRNALFFDFHVGKVDIVHRAP